MEVTRSQRCPFPPPSHHRTSQHMHTAEPTEFHEKLIAHNISLPLRFFGWLWGHKERSSTERTALPWEKLPLQTHHLQLFCRPQPTQRPPSGPLCFLLISQALEASHSFLVPSNLSSAEAPTSVPVNLNHHSLCSAKDSHYRHTHQSPNRGCRE